MLDGLREQIHGWLDAEPGLSAQEVLLRLTGLAPDRFKAMQLRTVQKGGQGLAGPICAGDHPDRRRHADDHPVCNDNLHDR
jgi:hypothetical protein